MKMMKMMTTTTATPPPSPSSRRVSRWCADERSVSCLPPWNALGRDGADCDHHHATNPFSLQDFFHACKTVRDYESCPYDEYHDCVETMEIEDEDDQDDLQQGDDHTVTNGDAEFSEFDKAMYCMDHDYTYLGEDEEDESWMTPPSLALPAKDEEETATMSHHHRQHQHQPTLPGGRHARFWYT